MRFRLAFASTLLFVTCGTSPSPGQIIDWTGGGSTDGWDDKNNWTSGEIPDTAGETPRFSIAGSFPVELPASYTVNDFSVTAGLPQLQPSSGVNPTITVSDDLIINNNAGLFVSTPGGEKFTIDVSDELRIDGGGSLTADTSVDGVVTILVNDLRLADLGSGSGDLTLIGDETVFEQTGLSIVNLGQDGPAQLTLSDRSRATFSAPLQLVNFADANSTASVLVESGSRLTLNSLFIATGGFNSGINGSLTVTGNNSVVTTTGATIVGGSSLPVGGLSVNTSGRFDSGGLVTVAASGTLSVDGGTLNAMAGLNAGAGTLVHDDGTINVTGGAFVPIADPLNSFYRIAGDDAGDLAEVVIGAGGSFGLNNLLISETSRDGALAVENGGGVSAEGVFVGTSSGGNGSLVTRGAGSTLTAVRLQVGSSGNGTVEILDQSIATVGEIEIAGSSGLGSGLLRVEDAGSELVVAPINLSGNGNIEVGFRSDGKLEALGGTIQASDLRVASLSPNVSAGDGTVLVDGGAIELSDDLIAGASGPSVIDINSGSLTVADQTILHPNAVVTIDGGSLETFSLDDLGGRLALQTGALTVNDPSQSLLIAPGGLSIGTLDIETDNSSPGQVLNSESYTVAGDIIVATGATLHVFSGVEDAGVVGRGLTIATGATVINSSGSSTIRTSGPLQMAIGSKLEMLGSTAQEFGDAGAYNGVVVAGNLVMGYNQVLTLLDANEVVFDFGALVESPGDTLSEMVVANGLTIDFGATVTGELIITSPDDPTKPVVNNGSIIGESLSAPVTLTGYVKGVGTCDNCVITGTDAPGFSPAAVNRGSVSYLGELEIEIGGRIAGSEFDQLNHVLGAGVADLGGVLDVDFINGFMPSAGDTFEIITAASLLDTFDTVSLPPLPADLHWFVNYGATSVELVSTYDADFDEDGDVDDDDLIAWEGGFGSLPATHMTGDANSNSAANGFDFLAWQRQYGSGGGAAAVAAAATAAPEPSSVALIMLGFFGRLLATRRHGRHGI